ncbi:MAG TPA: acetylxylan esterase, partial [Chthoniobacteraceae bacterium]
MNMIHPAAALVPLLTFTMIAAEPLPASSDLPAQVQPPHVLVLTTGERVTTQQDWQIRRAPELRRLIQHYEYGFMPPKPERLEARLLREDPQALGGKATLKEVEIQCTKPDAKVHLLIVVPNQRDGRVPCFLGLNFAGNYAVVADPQVQMPQGWIYEKFSGHAEHRAAEEGRGKQVEMWSIEQSIDRGYAVATFYTGDIVPDQPDLARERLKGFVPEGMNADDPAAPATIAAWAWGFSRMIDHLLTEPAIDPARIAAVGHSRNGKTALLAGAMDERIALVIPSQAGCGGTAPVRVAPELIITGKSGRP